jgi:hypothetical protein
VRTALWFMDSVRDGQPLGAALGYQFERGLHEGHAPLELDKFIDDLPHLLPARRQQDPATAASRRNPSRARNVVDGLALRRAWQRTQRGEPDGVPGPGSSPRRRCGARRDRGELRALDDVVDAITDVLTAESVYQAVRGSIEGAAASLTRWPRACAARS